VVARSSKFERLEPELAHSVARRYKLSANVAAGIKRLARLHGTQGRVIQVAVEILSRAKLPVEIPSVLVSGQVMGVTYRLTQRTIRLIDELSRTYQTRGRVLAACVIVLTDSRFEVLLRGTCDRFVPSTRRRSRTFYTCRMANQQVTCFQCRTVVQIHPPQPTPLFGFNGLSQSQQLAR